MSRRARRAFAVLTVAGTLAGCGGSGPARSPAGTPDSATPAASSSTFPPSSKLTVTSFEYSFLASGPVNLSAGKVTITLENGGTEQHNAQVIRVKKGISEAVVSKAATEDPTGAELLALGDPVGGPAAVSPGQIQETVQNLTPGAYLMFCLVRARSGEVHAVDGMVDQFNVTAGATGHPDPRPSARLRLTDGGFQLPSPFPRSAVLRVVNQGTQPHEVSFLRLPNNRRSADSTVAAYLRQLRSGALLQQPPPFPAAGGVAAISPGQSADVRVLLPPGEYLAICLLPGENGSPHAVHGMAVRFRVR